MTSGLLDPSSTLGSVGKSCPAPRLVKLADCVDLLSGFAFKSQDFTNDPHDVALVKGENVSQGRVLWDISKRWPLADWRKYEKFQLAAGDVVIAMDRPWVPAGLKWCFIRDHDPKALLVQRCCRLRANPRLMDQTFLRCVIGGPGFEGYIKPITTGVNIPHISGRQILDYSFPLPDLPTQRKIAGILSAYDDLIENNLRRIKILEEMAQSLYREWFVHFSFPGHESATFTDSPLGRIPKDWEVKPVSDLLEFHIGGGWGNDVADDKHSEPAFVIRGTDLPDARLCDRKAVPFRYHAPSNIKTRRLQSGDLVFEVSGGSKGQPVGRALLVSERLLGVFDGNDVICASFCKLLRTRSAVLLPELLLFHLLEIYDNGRINTYQVQSTGITNFKFAPFLEQEKVPVPPPELQSRWLNCVAPVMTKDSVLGATIQTLRQTRDLLLPRLLTFGK